jgi:serine/threonine-protein kinase
MPEGEDGSTVPDPIERPTVIDKPVSASSVKPKRAEMTTLATPSMAPSLTTAADAMRDEEVERTRLFIRMGWGISVASIGVVPILPAPLAMQIAMVTAMLVGIVVSIGFHNRFADPRNYTDSALIKLAMMCIVNATIAVLYFGVFTIAPVIIMVGIHFVARTEKERAGKMLFVTSMTCYALIATPLVAGLVADPGVFSTGRDLSIGTKLVGMLFVLGTYVLAYVTARVFRRASLASIEELARATRLASQREALMSELRADLERALRVGGPGRYSDQTFGSYKLGVVLGRGAIGEVYEAVHATTGEPAAVKLLRREMLADATQIARFLREARAGGALASPFVVRVLEASPDDAPVPYLAMERLHGTTLAEILRRDARLAPAAVAAMLRDTGAGIDSAAAAGVVHRDLKPQNLMHTDAAASGGNIWKLLDFGVATLAEDSGTLTQGGVVGTPAYMAPEQAQGQRTTARTDLYALAAVAYRCLTGRHPFVGSDTPTLLYAVVHRMPVRPGALADVDADVDALFAIALAKSPDDRFASGTALADAFADALAGKLDPALRKRGEALAKKHPWEVL